MVDINDVITIVDTIGKDKVFGLMFDNTRRAYRRKKPDGTFETFDERFTLDIVTGCVIMREFNVNSEVAILNYIPADYVQGVYALENTADINNIDFRYLMG